MVIRIEFNTGRIPLEVRGFDTYYLEDGYLVISNINKSKTHIKEEIIDIFEFDSEDEGDGYISYEKYESEGMENE